MVAYELTWTWGSAAAGCHAALEELGVDYGLTFIDLAEPWSPTELARNPHRKLPTLIDHGLETPAGEVPLVVYQSAAILNHLADRHPDAMLAPNPGTSARALSHQWMYFMAEMLQPSMMMVYYPERFTSAADEAATAAVAAKGIEWTDEIWQRLDQAVGGNAWFLGDDFSICDLYLLSMAMWNRRDETFRPLSNHAAISDLVDRICARPAVQRMIAAHYD